MTHDPYRDQAHGGDPYGGTDGRDDGDQRQWAVIAHLGALVTAWFAFGFIAPALVLLAKKEGPFLRRHALESLNFQISMLIYSVVGGILAAVFVVVTLGLGIIVVAPLYALVLLVVLVLIIVASRRAHQGRDFRYPFTLRLFN